ncbi:MAG: hypothetical protein GTO54_02475 [Nitrososphaeria archaeon]|nr:hypothetical protein [Nitrososphaeria archaeon]
MRLDLELMQGSIDTHAHSNPALFPRPWDHVEVAKNARDYDMKAVVLKCHHEGTAARAQLVRKMIGGVEVLGGIVLNQSVGGLNPFAVNAQIKWGAKVVWMPTVDARNHQEYYKVLGQYGDKFVPEVEKPKGYQIAKGISIPIGEDEEIPQNLADILDQVADADIALGSGHISAAEIKRLFQEAKKRGVKRMFVNHPAFSIPNLSVEDMKELANLGVYMEFVYGTLSPNWHASDIETVAANIREVGAEHCTIASDLGQIHNPIHPEGMRIYIRMLLERRFTEKEIERMVTRNPAYLVGL